MNTISTTKTQARKRKPLLFGGLVVLIVIFGFSLSSKIDVKKSSSYDISTEQLKDYVTEISNENGNLYLFRGHNVYDDRNSHINNTGCIYPNGGDATPEEHDLGDTQSNYVSTTPDYFTAYQFATTSFPPEGGIEYVDGFLYIRESNINTDLLHYGGIFGESQVLIEGCSCGWRFIPVEPGMSEIELKTLLEQNGVIINY